MARRPAVAGQFYLGEKKALKEQIEECFMSKFGPGRLPGDTRTKVIKGVIAPHAGYPFSGPCAAFAYKEIAEAQEPDLYVVLGPSHSGSESCISAEDWETPLGIAKNDKEFGQVLVDNSKIVVNEEAHDMEHSIEVQLPFLQFVNQINNKTSKENKDFKFLPLMVSHNISYNEIAKAIQKTAEQLKRHIIIIASSDLTHYGLNYGYIPFQDNVKENMHKLDKGAIDRILDLDATGFIEYCRDKEATICGALPIAALISTINAKKAKLLKYYTSGDIIGDYSNAVGYASVLFE
jgi:AmmeMemoRadiSam system protein B